MGKCARNGEFPGRKSVPGAGGVGSRAVNPPRRWRFFLLFSQLHHLQSTVNSGELHQGNSVPLETQSLCREDVPLTVSLLSRCYDPNRLGFKRDPNTSQAVLLLPLGALQGITIEQEVFFVSKYHLWSLKSSYNSPIAWGSL